MVESKKRFIKRFFDSTTGGLFRGRLGAVDRLFKRAIVYVRSQTVEAEAGGRLSVGLLTPGQGMPGA